MHGSASALFELATDNGNADYVGDNRGIFFGLSKIRDISNLHEIPRTSAEDIP